MLRHGLDMDTRGKGDRGGCGVGARAGLRTPDLAHDTEGAVGTEEMTTAVLEALPS